jgi:hypothetical protein
LDHIRLLCPVGFLHGCPQSTLAYVRRRIRIADTIALIAIRAVHGAVDGKIHCGHGRDPYQSHDESHHPDQPTPPCHAIVLFYVYHYQPSFYTSMYFFSP